MKGIFILIKRIILLGILFILITTGIDYYRISNRMLPVFNKRSYDYRTKVETFSSIIYKFERLINFSIHEEFDTDRKYNFSIFNISVPVKVKEKEKAISYKQSIEYTDTCLGDYNSYFESNDYKIYMYCIDDIKIQGDGKNKSLSDALTHDSKFINNYINMFDLVAVYDNGKGYVYKINKRYSDDDVMLYSCENKNIFIGNSELSLKDSICN